MNVCLVINSLGSGGAERVASTLANHWANHSWRVTVITLASADTDFYALEPTVRRVGLACAGESRGLLSGLANNITRVRRVRQVLLAEKPDVALGFMPYVNIICALACMGTRITAVGSEHIHPPMVPLDQPWRSLRRLLYPRLAAVSALTKRSAAWIIDHTAAKHVPVMPNPISYTLAGGHKGNSARPVLDQLPGEKTLLAVGRLVYQKGLDRLLDAFANLHRRHPDWHLVILGEGPLRTDLEDRLMHLGLNQCVAMPGAVADIGVWYAQADLYVMTSRFEGFGNTLAEALAYGVASIAVDCEAGPREILRHEVDGLLVPQNDARALEQALDRLMGCSALRARFAERAIEARERFAVEHVAAQWEQLFQSLRGRA